MKRDESKSKKGLVIINIYNFIRKTVYPSGEFVQEDFDTVLYQMEIIKQYGLNATYALKYDALIDERFSNLIKENTDKNDEIAVWWEVDKQLAEKSGVVWKGNTPVDDHVNIGYSLGYTPEERIKMVDTYMEDFKNIFGYYPKSVGSWVMDIVTFTYFKERYGIVAGMLCRDQIGTDGFTLNGGYYNGAYYPSKVNEYMPAQSIENQLNLPIFRMLGPDPIYSFEDGLREGVNCVYTLEPASVIAQNKEWVNWYFNRLIEEDNLGFSYAQVGQENTFLWSTMHKGYELQIPLLAKLEKEGKVRIQTLKESGEWFKKRYKLTPPTTFAASEDWNKEENLKTFWYNSRFYRVSFLYDKGALYIRDLHLFNEDYKSRYYDEILRDNESVFDALPILDAHYWSSKKERASINIVEVKNNGDLKIINGKEPEFLSVDEDTYKIIWHCDNNQQINILCKEDKILIERNTENSKVKEEGKTLIERNTNNLNNNEEENSWGINIKTIPVLRALTLKKIVCQHNKFIYTLELLTGEYKLQEDNSILISPKGDKIEIALDNKSKGGKNNEFFNSYYLENRNIVDKYINCCEKVDNISNIKLRAFKPQVKPNVKLSIGQVNELITIENPNDEGVVYYTLDGSEPNKNSRIYENEILIKEPCTIKSRAYKDGFKESEVVEGYIYESIPIKNIEGLTNPTNNKKYNKNGVLDLIDGNKGSKYYTDGNWLGYTEDMEVVIDLGEEKDIKTVMVGFLQDTRAWIYFPMYVEFKISIDGEVFKNIEKININNLTPRKEVGIENIKTNISQPVRYIKIFAKNYGLCPEWSIMAGEGPAFIFVDQVTVNYSPL